MIELWGADSCVSCGHAKTLLQRTPLEWKYVDVASTGFKGLIPRLVLEDGCLVVGLGPINAFVKQKLTDMGFPEGML